MKVIAKNRSNRLRKKLRVDEYQELGFDIAWKFEEGTTNEEIDAFVDRFFTEAIEPNGLGYAGEGDLLWHGLVCTQKLGKCTDKHRELVETWLKDNGMKSASVSELYDFWWS